MASSAKRLFGSRVWTQNGPVGTIKDILFNDKDWTIEHVVIGKYQWLPFGKVLVKPTAVTCPYGQGKVVTGMTRGDLRKCPLANTHLPLTQRKKSEEKNKRVSSNKTPVEKSAKTQKRSTVLARKKDLHLRSMKEVAGYEIQATDGSIGIVNDFMLNSGNWHTSAIVVKHGRAGVKDGDLISIDLIGKIGWRQRQVILKTKKDNVMQSLEKPD